MRTKSANVAIVSLTDGREVCLSYGVPVAAFIPSTHEYGTGPLPLEMRGYIRTARRYSVTSSKHASQYAGQDAPKIDDAIFRVLIAPVTGKGDRG